MGEDKLDVSFLGETAGVQLADLPKSQGGAGATPSWGPLEAKPLGRK